ncbi:S9 family peptidase [Salibacteraceae bacterium]|nr:S9 family peptidase [Salibacteraceae bacterium]MDB9708939.1 S9 family peptidase [Salibacteraceae bacterium]
MSILSFHKAAGVILAVLLSQSYLALSQSKTLTLSDAVLKQYSDLYPKQLNQLQWIPNTDAYCYIKELDDSQVLVMNDMAMNESVNLISLVELYFSVSSNPEFKKFPKINWINDNEFWISLKSEYYKIDVKSRKAILSFTLPETANDITFNDDFSACAFVLDRNLYYLMENGTQIQITSDGKPSIVYGQAVHRSEFGIQGGLFWAPDNNKLAFYRMDETMVEDYPLVDISTQPASLQSIKYPMAGRTSHHVTLGVFDPQKSTTVYMKTGEPKDKYLTSITWSPKSDEVYIGLLNRDQNQLQLNRYKASTGSLSKTLFEEADNEYVEPEHQLWFIPDNNDQFIWMSEREGFNHLYLYNTEGNLIRHLTTGNWEVKEIIGFDDTKNYLFLRGTGETTQSFDKSDNTRNATHRFTYILDFELLGTKILDDRLGFHTAKLSKNGKYLIEDFSSIETPLETSIWSAVGKKLSVIHAPENPLDDYNIGKPEIFSIQNGNSDLLYARLIKPSNFDPSKKYPVLLYLYGGPHAQLVTNQFMAGAPLWMYWMAEQGYVVATIDNRGSANRGIEFEQSTFRKLGTNEMDDQKRFVDYLISQSYVDSDRMAIHGWSFGGFMTMNMMLTFPGLFKAGVAGGPVCDWSMYEVMYTERYMDTPQTNEEGYLKANLIDKAKKLQDDLLVIHGTMDNVVLWQHSQAFVESCVDNGVQLDYFIYPGHEHNWGGKDNLHLMQKVLSYIDERIGQQ